MKPEVLLVVLALSLVLVLSLAETVPTGSLVLRGNVSFCVNFPVIINSSVCPTNYTINDDYLCVLTAQDGDTLTWTDEHPEINISSTGIISFTATESSYSIPVFGDDGDGCSNSIANITLNLTGVEPAPAPTTTTVDGGGRRAHLDSRILELSLLLREAIDLKDGFFTRLKRLFVELEEKQFSNQEITLRNPTDEDVLVRLTIPLHLKDSIIVQSDRLRIPAKGEVDAEVLFLANRPPGTYEGTIVLESSSHVIKLPFTLKILKRLIDPERETLDIDVDVISDIVYPGQDLRLKVNIRKVPLISEEPEDVNITVLITSLVSDSIGYITQLATGEITAEEIDIQAVSFEENFVLVNAVTFPLEYRIPEDFPPGNYILIMKADYKGKSIPVFVKYEKYEISGDTLKRKQPFCPKCGPGIFLASHKDRKNCGSCGYMEKN